MDEITPTTQKEVITTAANTAANVIVAHADSAAKASEYQAELKIRERSLNLSGGVVVGVLTAYIYFAYIGKTLIIPDIVWCIVLAPWFGAGSVKLITLFIEIWGKKNV